MKLYKITAEVESIWLCDDKEEMNKEDAEKALEYEELNFHNILYEEIFDKKWLSKDELRSIPWSNIQDGPYRDLTCEKILEIIEERQKEKELKEWIDKQQLKMNF